MRKRERIYDAALRAAAPVATALAGLHPKGDAAVAGRKRSAAEFAEWSRSIRDPARQLILVHAPSVGEGLMAQAIITQIRSMIPDAQIAFTFFSPSAERIAASVGADIAGYLPLDTKPAARETVSNLRPDAVAYIRTEIWPMLGLEAQASNARVVLLNAVLSEGSSRLRGPARYLLGPAYRRLDAIGAVATEDASRFAALGVDADRVCVTGDARFDQVWHRVQSLDRNTPALTALRSDRKLMVAGSTWGEDEDALLQMIAQLPVEARPRIAIAPHEPDASHIAALIAKLENTHVSYALFGNLAHKPDADVVVVDRVGVLADLYAAASIAYVGGGFGDNGLHSVVEPAALGVPSVYGPRHGNAREGGDLAGAGGGFIVHNAADLTAVVQRLMTDATAREVAGTAAMTFVQSRLGGARRNAELVCNLIRRS